MLQQTRVAAVLPYYDAFLAKFPDAGSLAQADEQEVLSVWAGLGYYSRARNLQKAARLIVKAGAFPSRRESILALPGVGDYTAAAVSSIAFNQPHAAIDGNVVRVLSRVSAEPGEVQAQPVRARLKVLAQSLLDPERPGDFNQAMMELGATVCVPSQPRCLGCPVRTHCRAHSQGRQNEFPIKRAKPAPNEVQARLLLIEREGSLLLWQRPPESRRLAGFWELPSADQLPSAKVRKIAGSFRHSIVNTNYNFEVVAASVSVVPAEFLWVPFSELTRTTLSTTARKALAFLTNSLSR